MGLGKLTDHLALADIHLIAEPGRLRILRRHAQVTQVLYGCKSPFLIQDLDVLVIRKIFNLIHEWYPPHRYDM